MDFRVFYNPLAVLGRRAGLIVAVVAVAGLAAVSWWGSVHQSRSFLVYAFSGTPSLPLIVAQTLVAWVVPAIVLLIVSWIFGGDLGGWNYFAAVGISRIPFILSAVILSTHTHIGLAIRSAATNGLSWPLQTDVILGIIGLVLLTVWATLMLFFGTKEASGLQGGRAVVVFIIGMVLAEWAGRYLMDLIVYWG